MTTVDRASTASVLVVDDDPSTCDLLAYVLEAYGYHVRTVSLGQDGLAILPHTPIDIAVLDLKLPDMSGLELLEAIKRRSPATEVIFITAYASTSTAVQAINNAAFGYLTKPFDPDHLVATVARAREKQQLVRRLRESEERYRLLVEHIHDAVFLVDLEGRVLFGNGGLATLSGHQPDELMGRSIFELLTPEGAEAAAARREAVRVDPRRQFRYETEVVRRDGTRRWVEVTSTSVVEDDAVVARIGVARDVTERRESEHRRAVEHALGTILAEATDVPAAAASILGVLGPSLGSEVGTFWTLDPATQVLQCAGTWAARPGAASELLAATRAATFAVGVGLPGRVLAHCAPLWIPDVATEPAIPRAAAAQAAGLRAFFGFPVALGRDVVGVLEFFGPDTHPPDGALLDWIASLGRQIALFCERTRAQHRLRETNLALESLIQSSPVAVVALDHAGCVTGWNRSAERVFGWSETEVRGRPLPIIPDGEATESEATREAWLRGTMTTDVEVLRRRKDGSTVVVSRTGGALRDADGRVVGTIANLVDITERKRAESALRESEARFRAVFEQAAVGMGVGALDGRWLRANQRLCDMVGYTAEELCALRFQDITHPDDLPQNLALREEMLSGRRSEYALEKRYLRKDGGIVWVAVAISVVADAAGAPAYSVAVVQDITGRKELERELAHAQRMEGIGQLAGGIAHDFNNLLTVITGRADLGLNALAPSHPLYAELDVIQKTAERAAALTRQLLAFSRKQILQPRILALDELVAGFTKLLTRLIGEDIELRVAPAAGTGRVRADPGQLEQVIVNLVVNARDAMPQGGTVTIETANVDLDDAYAARHVGVAAGRYVMLAVSDTGVGMSADVQARIFEPFFTTKPPGKGTGLGLATVYGIVRQTDGHVRVYSEPGLGTTFRVYLPRTEAIADPRAAAGAPPAARGTETVLLVEDEAGVRDLAREVLERSGYTVLEAPTPAEALALAERHAGVIDVLLTDVVMPGMSGRALADAITRARPRTTVVFMSGYTNDAILHHGVLEAGIHFVEKPFAPRELTAKIREALGDPRGPGGDRK
ncbi:MAG TPA: PAS domain S-box protein [Terriglobales bacterium]|nr:PAS domain S-box protein [Terriglobales bacterium]